MTKPVHITIAEASEVIRQGITTVLAQTGAIAFVASEIADARDLKNALATQPTDILIINPSFMTMLSLPQIRHQARGRDMKCVVLQTSLADGADVSLFDEAISIYDTGESIRSRLAKLITPASGRLPEPLSPREMEIVACVVRGMTNRQIADHLCLSPHTVGTHRRNISSKLDIHTTSGLTIYAISNKLVRLDELKRLF